jgi:hypothetical protein
MHSPSTFVVLTQSELRSNLKVCTKIFDNLHSLTKSPRLRILPVTHCSPRIISAFPRNPMIPQGDQGGGVSR